MQRVQQLYHRMPTWLKLLSGGVAATLGFAPFFVWPLGLLGLSILIAHVQQASRTRQAVTGAYLWGMAHLFTLLYWLPHAFYVEAGNSWQALWLTGVPALVGLCAVFALQYALLAAVTQRIMAPGWRRGAVFCLGWLLCEVGRDAAGSLGFPWTWPGAMWAGHPLTLQLAALNPPIVGGIGVLSALVLLLAFCLSQATRRWLGTAVAIASVCLTFGAWRLQTAPNAAPAFTAELALIQPNALAPNDWDPYLRWEYLQTQMALIQAQPHASLLILPETALPYFIEEDTEIRTTLAQALAPHQQLVAGFPRRSLQADGRTMYFNSLGLMDATGQLHQTYDKTLLVPFGEYIPLRGLFSAITRPFLPQGLHTHAFHRSDYAPGSTGHTIALGPSLTALPLICFEGIFSRHVRSTHSQADVLLNISNDAWFGPTSGPAQHFALTRVRAVETGKPLIRVANGGTTGVVDGFGRLFAAP